MPKSEADLGFPVGGGANPRGTNIQICQIFPKKCMKLRKCWSVGGHSRAPLGSATVNVSITELSSWIESEISLLLIDSKEITWFFCFALDSHAASLIWNIFEHSNDFHSIITVQRNELLSPYKSKLKSILTLVQAGVRSKTTNQSF